MTWGTGRERCRRNISGELTEDFANASKRCRPTVQGAVHTPSRGNAEKTTPRQTIAKQPLKRKKSEILEQLAWGWSGTPPLITFK